MSMPLASDEEITGAISQLDDDEQVVMRKLYRCSKSDKYNTFHEECLANKVFVDGIEKPQLRRILKTLSRQRLVYPYKPGLWRVTDIGLGVEHRLLDEERRLRYGMRILPHG